MSLHIERNRHKCKTKEETPVSSQPGFGRNWLQRDVLRTKLVENGPSYLNCWSQECDLAMGPFFPAEERLEIANPTTVFFHEELRILAGRASSQHSSVFGYILAFDWMVSHINVISPSSIRPSYWLRLQAEISLSTTRSIWIIRSRVWNQDV